jgi:adenylate cyclase
MRPLIKHLVLGLACGLAAMLLGQTTAAEIAELKIYDLLHVLRSLSPAPENIVLVAIDEASFAELGLQWPWPRSLHGRLAISLSKAGAAAIGFDILFPEPSHPEEDRAFSEALASVGNVVLASEMNTSEGRYFERRMMVEPIPALKQHVRTGIVSIPLDRDYVVRRMPHRAAPEGLFAEALVAAAGRLVATTPEDAYISYGSPPNSYLTVSYYQALESDRYLPKGIFKGKIVIVGRTTVATVESEKGVSDYFATPFLLLASAKNCLMSGIEVHANIVHDILAGEFVTRMGSAERATLVLLIGALAGLLQFHWRPCLSAVFTATACLGLAAAAFILFDRYGYWIPVFSFILPFGFSYATFGADAYLYAEQKKREIKRAFSHYLSPSVLEAVLANPEGLKLGGIKVEATVLFSDIAGFTKLSEQNAPEVISRLLNRYMTAMTKIIMLHNGTIDKFIGDAIMAFWGAPLPDPEHAMNACRAAVEMRERLASLNRELRENGLPEVSFRIGINTGEVIVGNMGSEELFDYTVIGDTVNLASRLEGANKQFDTDILISRLVYDKVKDRIEARSLGKISVKGKADMVEVYALLAIIGGGQPTPHQSPNINQ